MRHKVCEPEGTNFIFRCMIVDRNTGVYYNLINDNRYQRGG